MREHYKRIHGASEALTNTAKTAYAQNSDAERISDSNDPETLSPGSSVTGVLKDLTFVTSGNKDDSEYDPCQSLRKELAKLQQDKLSVSQKIARLEDAILVLEKRQ